MKITNVNILLDKKVKFEKYENNLGLQIDGLVILTYPKWEHLENVYADWECLDDTTFYDEKFDHITIENVKDGFRINGYLVNCYNEENGYFYNNDLTIKIFDTNGGLTISLDVLTEEEIEEIESMVQKK